jgi:hypothetical protein
VKAIEEAYQRRAELIERQYQDRIHFAEVSGNIAFLSAADLQRYRKESSPQDYYNSRIQYSVRVLHHPVFPAIVRQSSKTLHDAPILISNSTHQTPKHMRQLSSLMTDCLHGVRWAEDPQGGDSQRCDKYAKFILCCPSYGIRACGDCQSAIRPFRWKHSGDHHELNMLR